MLIGVRRALLKSKKVVASLALPTWMHLAHPAWQTSGYTATKPFTSVAIGSPGTGNLTVIAVAFCDTGGDPDGSITSSLNYDTGGGPVTATKITSSATALSSDPFIEYWAFPTPAGSTATITIGLTSTFSAGGIFVGQLTGVNLTSTFQATPLAWNFVASPWNSPGSITVPTHGYGLAASVQQNFGGADPVWSTTPDNLGVTTGATASNGTLYKMSTAYQTSTATPTLTLSGGDNAAAVGAAWGP